MPERLLRNFQYGKTPPHYFKQFSEQLAVINCTMCSTLCLFGLVIGGAFSCLSFLFETLAPGQGVYLSLFTVCLCGRIFCTVIIRRRSHFPIAVYYLLLAAVFLVAIYLSLFSYQDGSSSIAVALMAALSVFIVDLPGRLTLFWALIEVLFCAAAILQKGDAALLDCITGGVFFFLSCYIARFNIQNKLQELRYQSHIKRQRDTDGLTRLYTRGAAERDISQYLQGAEELCAMVLIDIDHFKAVNDTLGHAYGDKLLMNISATLKRVLRREDYIARIGGDEFIVFFHEISNRAWIEKKVQQLVDELEQSISDDRQAIGVSASVGIAYTGQAAATYDDLYHHADAAMYKAKQAGGNRFAVYTGNAIQPVRFPQTERKR